MTKTDPTASAVSLEERPLTYDELAARKGELDAQALLLGLRDGRALVRANAALGLAVLGHSGRDLVPFLRDSHPVAARAAGEAFAHLGLTQRAHLAVIAAALDGARREVVDSVVTMFALFVGPADADLVNVLDTGDGFAVDAVVEACSRAGLRGLQLLQTATLDDRARVRLNAVGGVGQLAHIEPVSSVNVLRRAAETDSVSDVRAAAITAIAAFMARNRLEVSAQRKQAGHRSLSSVPDLHTRALTPDELRAAVEVAPLDEMLHALLDERVEVRLNAVRVLALQGAAAAGGAPSLAVVTRDRDATVRAEAARALGALGAAGVAAAPALVRALGDAEPAVVAAAEAALAEQGAAAAPVLVEGLLVSDEAHGARVAALIGRLADGPNLLREALASTSLDVRINAALGLGALGKERAGATLPSVFATKSSGNARLRAALASAIARLDPKPDRTLPPIAIDGFEQRVLTDAELAKGKDALAAAGVAGLVPRLADAREVVRANTALALGVVGGDAPGVVDALAVCLRDDAAEVRLAAARALDRLGEAAVAASARDLVRALGRADAPMATQLIATLRAHAHPAIAAALVGGLDTTDAQRAMQLCELMVARPDGIDLLCEALTNASADIQVNAAAGLGALGKARAAVALPALAAAKSGGDARVRAAVAKAIATLDPKPDPTPPPIAIDGFEQRVLTDAELAKGKAALVAAGVAGLVVRLADARAAVRANAALALGVVGDAPGVVEALAVCLRDDAAEVRMAAARALERLGEAAVAACANDLVRALGRADAPLAAQLAAMLRAHAHPAIAAALVRGLDTTDSQDGLQLCELLCARPAGIELLCEALASTSVDVQINAALGLGALGKAGAAAVPALTAAKSGASGRVRAVVAGAIEQIDASPIGTVPPIAVDGFEQRVLTDAELTKGKAAFAAAGVAGIVPRLADASPTVRANAALALGVVGGDGAGVVDVLAVCLRDDAVEVRMGAARALERLGEAAVAICADELVRALGRADGPLAAQLVTMLRTHAHSAIGAALVRGLESSNTDLALQLCELVWARPGGIDQLCEAFARPAAQANVARGFVMLGKERLGKGRALLLESARTGSSPRMREIARATLHAIDGPPPPPAVPAVPGFETELLEHRAFAKVGNLDVQALLAFVTDGRAVVRANAATGVGALGATAAAHALTIAALLRDDDDRVRIAAARALDQLGDDAVVAAARYLVAALGGSAAVAEACSAVLTSRKAKVEAALIAGLEASDEAHGMRVADLVCALPNARELLFAAFDGEAQNVQINAAFGIGKLGAKRAGPEGRRRLLNGLPGPPTRRRAAMVKALALLGPDGPAR